MASAQSPLPADPIAGGWLDAEPRSVPMLPRLAQHVIDVAGDPEVSVPRLTALVSKDQVLASRVLGIANSAYSAPAQEISTLTSAIVRLGTTAVRNVVITVCFSSRMHDPKVYGDHGQRLVEHALGTAYLARLVAEHVRVNPDELFLCGLLHDIGKLVILKQAHDHGVRTRSRLPPEEVGRALDDHHAGLGAVALRRWRLPDSLQEPVRHHHDYAAATSRRTEAAVVYLANRLAHRYGFGCPSDESDVSTDPVLAFLGLGPETLAEVGARAPGLVKVASEILS